jgi:hypothetical protein
MISTAGAVGAMDLCKASRTLQEAIRSREPAVYLAALDDFGKQLSIVIKGLKSYFHS